MDESIVIVDDDRGDDPPIIVASPRTTRATANQNTPNRVAGGAALLTTTPDNSPLLSKKKRRRTLYTPSPQAEKSPKAPPPLLEDDDDGATCPICLDNWEMSGDHRLTSLKCGHLFGQSCIRRWLQECATGTKCCPSCKTKATPRDFRFLYAKRLCAIDNTETVMLKGLLDESRQDVMKLTTEKSLLDFELGHHRNKVLNMQEEINYLRGKLANSSAVVSSSQPDLDASMQRLNRLKKVKLFLEKNIDISREGGCRCMNSSRSERLLFVSQKSSQSLFPGYGIRYIDLETMKPMNYVHVSAKQIRDLAVTDHTEDQPNFLLTATLETSGRLFDVASRALVQTYKPTSLAGGPDQPLWCCAHEDCNVVWFGGQQGKVFQFDKRNPAQQRLEFSAFNEPSPLINVAHIPADPSTLPFGGLLVCSLKALSFFQFIEPGQQQRRAMPISIEGPFSSMSYDRMTGFVLVTTRSNKKFPNSRYILGRFEKAPGQDIVTLVVKYTFLGSDVMPVMSRPVQYPVYGSDSVLMSAYLQSTKMLTTWAVEHNLRVQSLSVSDTILDMCPVYISGVQHLAALADNRCRIFKIHEDRL